MTNIGYIDRYLSNEQRLNYLVEIDSDGKLHWARNKMLVDTTAGHWKDAGNGEGIVPEDEPDAPPRPSTNVPSSSTSSRSASSGSLDNAAMHYIGVPKGRNKLMRAFWRNFTIRGLGEKLLRKTVRRNTWIYVSDKNFNIFVGIKGRLFHLPCFAPSLTTAQTLGPSSTLLFLPAALSPRPA
ncbi:hypothetical protein DENSPDRAFT_485592 [Dentipellis sp. KUC8613]|nr:hypothetical protein DENSPDRAFT_485592 [Dentipellis sp. KUC8613]